MEAFGLTAGILPLFKTCLDYFQLYKTAQASERDTRILLYKLDCEHERFIIWGEKHGAFEEHPYEEGHIAPGLSDKVPQIEEALKLIRELLSDAEELRGRYGVTVSAVTGRQMLPQPPYPSTWGLRRLKWRRRPRDPDSHGLIQKTVWAINEKAKFNELIVQLREIVESLYRVLPVPTEERFAVAVQDIGAIAGDLEMLEDFEMFHLEREVLPFDLARRYYGSPIFVFTQDCISPASPKCSVERFEIDPDAPTFVFPDDKDKYWGLGNRITGIVDPKVDDAQGRRVLSCRSPWLIGGLTDGWSLAYVDREWIERRIYELETESSNENSNGDEKVLVTKLIEGLFNQSPFGNRIDTFLFLGEASRNWQSALSDTATFLCAKSPHLASIQFSQSDPNNTTLKLIAMDQQEQSCKRHDFMVLSASGAFMRTCLSCGLVEDVQVSQQKQHADSWEGWLRSEIQPLSWPRCVQYSDTVEATLMKTARGDNDVYSYRPNVQTSLQNDAQREGNPYVYSDLPKGSCIRLLELSPGNRLEILSGRLFEVWWEQETCPPYSALSYTWADEEGNTSLSNLIFLDKAQKVLRITRNCDRALRSLRHKTKPKLLWVDSICINQSSASERSHQVGLMRTIYSKATTVHSYVGETVCGDDSTGTEAMTLLNDLQVNAISDILFPSKAKNLSVLNKFFARSYFARLWIVQELLLAQSITIHCGEISLKVTNESISQLYDHGIKVPSWVRFVGKARSNTEQAPLDLRDLLAATSVCRVTDLRDKIFGLLGLISNVQAAELSPDYDLMVRKVYIGVAAYLIQKSHCCDLIQHANPYWVRNWAEIDRQPCKDDYGIPSWVPLWDVDVPLQAFQGISRHVEQIELDSKRLLSKETLVACCTIRSIDGWPHGNSSECNRAARCCKMVDQKSGFLTTRIETVFRLNSSFEPAISVGSEFRGMGDNEYFTGFWNLKDGLKLAIRSFAWALRSTSPRGEVHLIRIEGCTTLFLAQPTSNNGKYRLIGSCVATIVCQTRESCPAEILKSGDLHRYLQFTPLTVEMIHFIAKWRNQVLELARSDPEEREQISSIKDKSYHNDSRDNLDASRPSWRSWIPFLTLETRKMLEDDSELQNQLPNLVDFWHMAHILHMAIRDWTKSTLQVLYYSRNMWWTQLRDVENALEDHVQKSHKVVVSFERITGSRSILQSLHPLQLLLEIMGNREVKWTGDELLGYSHGLEGLSEDYDRLLLALDEDQALLDQAFPLDLKDKHSEYSKIKETIEWKPVLAGLVRGNTEAKDVIFI
ncbi:heterokaryon incompatibility protein het-6 [Fusarium denticulatum]|uniref:Heterokaryon incompatibility protein het-6 n=1 Tax=Fusarium denticulatum TaxID=48507 RepID=A0A8H5U8L0_9HYPO|nr:heterokaryon incompatibility protein het-6 [Fusarium denticulatum]